jgi:site-specific DNA recombinase
MMESFERRGVSFVAVTQQFNTTNSLDRLTLNILLSFAQFECELISERTRDKLTAARKKGKWIGGHPMLGYDIDPKGGKLVVNPEEAHEVRAIFDLYLEHRCLLPVVQELDRRGWRTKLWMTRDGWICGGKPFTKGRVHYLLSNVIYTGCVNHNGQYYPGEHEAIVDSQTWDQAQTILQHNGTNGGADLHNKYHAVLRGLLFCVPCGVGMIQTCTVQKARRYRYYVCYNAQQKGWDSCPTKSVRPTRSRRLWWTLFAGSVPTRASPPRPCARRGSRSKRPGRRSKASTRRFTGGCGG